MDRDILPIASEIILLVIGGVLLLYRLGRPTRHDRRHLSMRLSLLLVALLLACIEVGLYANTVQAAVLH
jgi:nitrate reductase gamma subunit